MAQRLARSTVNPKIQGSNDIPGISLKKMSIISITGGARTHQHNYLSNTIFNKSVCELSICNINVYIHNITLSKNNLLESLKDILCLKMKIS